MKRCNAEQSLQSLLAQIFGAKDGKAAGEDLMESLYSQPSQEYCNPCAYPGVYDSETAKVQAVEYTGLDFASPQLEKPEISFGFEL